MPEDNFGFTEGGAPHTDEQVKRLLVDRAKAAAFKANSDSYENYIRAHHNWSQVYVRCAEQGGALPPALVPPMTVLVTVKPDGYPEFTAGTLMEALPPPDISKLQPVTPSGAKIGVQLIPGWFQALPGDSFANGEFYEPPGGIPFRKGQKKIVPWSDAGAGYWVVV